MTTKFHPFIRRQDYGQTALLIPQKLESSSPKELKSPATTQTLILITQEFYKFKSLSQSSALSLKFGVALPFSVSDRCS